MRPFPLVLVLLLVFTAAGCSTLPPAGGTPPPSPQAPAAAYARPSDGLLQRPDLQTVVERQTRRDSSALRAFLTDEDPAIRARAALAVGSVQDPAAVPLLLGLLDDPNPTVRADVAFALGQSADSTAALRLIDALRTEADPAVQRLLLDALGKTGGAATLSALPTLDLHASLDPARALAIARYGLRGVFDRDATDWLVNHLTAPDPELRQNAAYLFGRVRDPEPWRYAASRLLAASDSLSADDPTQQYLAVALGRLESSDARVRLIQLLRTSGGWHVRTNAARALVGSTSDLARDALLRALDDPSVHVAVTAAGAVAAADSLSEERLNLVEAAMEQHGSWQVWTTLVPVLARNGLLETALRRVASVVPPPTSHIMPRGISIERPQDLPFAQAAALSGLAGTTDPTALDVLRRAATDEDPRVAYAALEALKTSWKAERSDARAPFYFPLFAAALERRDLATAYAAAPALADSLFRPLGASAVLRETYGEMTTPEDIEPMVEIVRALGEVRDTMAVPFLLDVAINGPHPTIRKAAAETLSERFGRGIDFEATGLAPPDFPAIDWDYLRSLGRHPLLTLETDRGTVVLELDTEAAPVTVQAIARNAETDRYDGVPFHRVVPNFVVQGGDYARADGFGGPGYFLPSEFARIPYERGTLGMASAGKDTEGSQFFITHSMQPHLDGRYTAFGRVVQGQEVVDQILQGDRVLTARVTSDE